eukprot:4022538-Amphidinium_carterae.1
MSKLLHASGPNAAVQFISRYLGWVANHFHSKCTMWARFVSYVACLLITLEVWKRSYVTENQLLEDSISRAIIAALIALV